MNELFLFESAVGRLVDKIKGLLYEIFVQDKIPMSTTAFPQKFMWGKGENNSQIAHRQIVSLPTDTMRNITARNVKNLYEFVGVNGGVVRIGKSCVKFNYFVVRINGKTFFHTSIIGAKKPPCQVILLKKNNKNAQNVKIEKLLGKIVYCYARHLYDKIIMDELECLILIKIKGEG